jgi:isopentenyl phosphate kinase
VGESNSFVVVKLGGSLITNKDVPLSANLKNIRLVARELSRAQSLKPNLRIFLIHGGGSFGHYFAKEFSLGTELSKKYPAEGLAKTSAAMMRLHSIILEELSGAGVYCTTVLPLEIFSEKSRQIILTKGQFGRLNDIFENKLTPLTFGFVNLVKEGAYIVSGDKIALALSKAFPIERVIFAMDVDGIYPSRNLKGPVLKELKKRGVVNSFVKKYDVTGGIVGKISTGLMLSNLGTNVFFVNGTKVGRLSGTIIGLDGIVATRIYSAKKGTRYP